MNEERPDRLPGLGEGPTIWLAEHRAVSALLFVTISGILGYFGLLGRMSPQAVSPGLWGLVYGVATSLAALVPDLVAPAPPTRS